jgi:hypothetical protein
MKTATNATRTASNAERATLADIERLTLCYRNARAILETRVRILQNELEAAKRHKIGGIRSAVNDVAFWESSLKVAIESLPELFTRPRTRIFNGIKVGFRKLVGTIAVPDAERTVELIRKHLPEQADVLIRTVEQPVKDALEGLSTADLKRIGCTVQESGDEVVVKSTDTEVDKLVSALLKGAEDEATGKAA